MKSSRKIAVTLAAVVVAGQIGGWQTQAAPTAGEVSTIQGYLASGNYAALAGFLESNPNLLVENTPLAAALNDFVSSYRATQGLAFSPASLDQMEAALGRAQSAASGAASRSSIY
jgi:hypothetical protein